MREPYFQNLIRMARHQLLSDIKSGFLRILTTNLVHSWPSFQVTTTSPCSQPLQPRGREASSEPSNRKVFTPPPLQPTLASTRFALGSQRTRPFLDHSLAGEFIVQLVCPDLFDILKQENHQTLQLRVFIRTLHFVQTPSLSPGTWEDCSLCAAGTSLDFHCFGPGMRRVDLDLTVDTS